MKKWWIVTGLAAALICCGSAGILVQAQDTHAAQQFAAQTDESTQLDTYRIGHRFTVPAYSFSTGAGEVAASSVLIAPDGKATVATSVVLDKAGKWTIRYSAKANGKIYSHEVSFLVLSNAYSMKDSLSSASYGRYTGYGSDSEGLQVRLAMNDALTFEKIIDLSDLTATEPLIRGFATPTTRGVADFGRIIFTLTDAKDPSVYLQVMGSRYKNSNERGIGVTYFAANGNGQYATGIETEANVHVADGLGTPVDHSFVSQKNNDGWAGPAVDTVPDQYPFTLTFDKDELIVYVNNKKVVDLDDAKYFEELWYGFPSGKVRLTVSASQYTAATANFCLTDVYGIDLTEEVFVDDEAPVIKLQVDEAYRVGDSYHMPEGRMGGSYPVPGATATDEISGACAVDVKAYYNHLSEHPIAVPVIDGKFPTESFGDYGIVYTATDAMGNVAQEVLNVHVGDPIPALTITCPSNAPVEVGYLVELLPPEMQGGSGTKTWTATATRNGTTLDATEGFYPETAGEWTIEYTATDFIGTVEKASCTLTVTPGVKPILPTSIALPNVMIAGAAYTLPVVYAKDYTSGALVSTLCDVEIKGSDGIVQATKKAGETFTPTAQAGTVSITYKCGTAVLGPVEVAVIDPWSKTTTNALNIGAYFSGTGFTAQVKNDNGVTVSAAAAQDFTWTFANAQLAENASVVLKNIAGKTNCSAFEVVFTDANNGANSVKMRLGALGTGTQVTVGDRSITLTKSFTGTAEETFEVSYASKRLYIGTTAMDVTNDASGKPFAGFKDKVYISVKAIGVTASTQYLVKSVSGCEFTTFAYDVDAPKISVLGDYGGTYAAGDIYTISPALAGDVYCPNVTLSLTVRDPQGNVVKDVNGLALSNVEASAAYNIVLAELGQYRVSYTSSEVDWKNRMGRPNTSTLLYTVNVLDSHAPTVTFKHDFAATAKVGDTLVIPDFTVTDDVTATENILVLKYVLNPDGRLITLTGNSIKCEYAGEYEFRIIVRDEAGNTNLYKRTVLVQ